VWAGVNRKPVSAQSIRAVIMSECNSITKKGSNMTITEASVVTERLYYLLQTITENHYKLEDAQRFCLLEIAWEISGQVNSWMNAEEERNGSK